MENKIFYVCPDIPTEKQSGRQLRDFALLRLLKKVYKVEVFSFKRLENPALFELDIPLHAFERKSKSIIINDLKKIITSFFSPNFQKYPSKKFSQLFKQISLRNHIYQLETNLYFNLSENSPTQKTLWLSHPKMLPTLSNRILNLHRNQKNFKIYLDLPYTESSRHRFFKLTKKYIREIDHLFVPSELSRTRIEKHFSYVKNCPQVSILTPFIQIQETPKKLEMELQPNLEYNVWISLDLDLENHLESFKWFYSEVLPRIKNTELGHQIKILAPLPNRIPIKKLSALFSEIHWIRKNEEDQIFNKNPLCVIPLIKNPGAPIACLKALGRQHALIASSKATEALMIQPSENFILAESEDGFASAICKLLLNKEFREVIALSGFNAAKKNHHWTELPQSIVQALS